MADAGAPGRDRILTVPNLVSLLRFAGVPLFLWLILGAHADGWAVVVLAVGGTTDWVDGFLARRLHQVSRFGELFDPLVDRLYIVATLVALVIRDVVPVWFVVVLIAREVFMAGCLLVLRRYGYGALPVHYLGKSATFILLFALPTLLLAHVNAGAAGWAYPCGWALAWWGLALYWIAAGMYFVQIVGVVRAPRPGRVAA